MSNWKLILRVIGMLLFIEAGLLLLCFGVGLFYHEDAMFSFLWPAVIAASIGIVNMYVGRGFSFSMSRKDGYFIVSFIWLIYTLIGMLPFLISGVVDDVASAFFETMSGFTSTGATIIDNCDIQPRCILFWRSIAQWIGGIGIIFFTVAILPAFGVGEVKLFAAESTGPFRNKVHPRISVAARWIGTVYLLLTATCILSLILSGTSVFDGICYSLTITATGGYAPHSALIRDVFHNSALIEYIMILFMIFSGVNYTLLYYTFMKGHFSNFFKDAELRCFFLIFGSATFIITVVLTIYKIFSLNIDTSTVSAFFTQLELSFRDSLFTVVSLQTTTGLANCDYTLWPMPAMPLLLFIMFAGACSGSTSSGFKCVRWSLIYRITRNEFRHILHPRAILPVRYNGQVVNNQTIRTLFGFTSLFVGSLLIGAFILAISGVSPDSVAHPDFNPAQDFDFYDALGLAMSSISNVGPGMEYYGPMHSWSILSPFAKYTCSFLMLIGRLEIFPVLLLFTRSFWKKA